MSAHLCLMAWKLPIGRPNWMRVLAYSTDASSTRCAPPTCSAASATAARSRVLDRPGSAPPSVPMSVAGRARRTPGGPACGSGPWSAAACASARARHPAPRRARRPWPVRAATTIRLATWPSITNILWPSSTQPSPFCVAAQLDAAEVPLAVVLGDGEGGDRLARGDAREVALLGLVVARGEQRVGGQGHRGEERRAQQRGAHLLEHDHQLDVGEARAAELLGDGQRLQARAGRPSGSRPPGRSPRSVSIRRRTSVSGDFSARNRRTAVRSSSCSSLNAKFMPGSSACSPRQPAGGPSLARGVYQTRSHRHQSPVLCHAGGRG